MQSSSSHVAGYKLAEPRTLTRKGSESESNVAVLAVEPAASPLCFFTNSMLSETLTRKLVRSLLS